MNFDPEASCFLNNWTLPRLAEHSKSRAHDAKKGWYPREADDEFVGSKSYVCPYSPNSVWTFGCLGVCLSPHVFSLMLHISFQSGNLDRPSDFAAVIIESLTDRARVWSRHDWLLLVDLKHVNLSENDGKNMGQTQNPMVYHGLSSLFSFKIWWFFSGHPKKEKLGE